ncbi:MAG TPA: histidine kinase [Blastococcus sp.]|nr:histidine kinase [Blastococcus sp.]
MRRRLPRPTWVDAVLAAVVLALGVVELAVGEVRGPYWATVPSVLLFAVPLLWRRQFPWTALLVVFGTIFGLHLTGASQYNYLASVASALLVMATFAGAVELREAIAGLVLAAAALVVSALVGVSGVIWGVGLLVGAWVAGRLLRARRLLIEELARTSEELRHSREAHAQAAVAAERTRIARELHDVIAHSVGVMVVQAGAAERMIPLDPDRAVAAAQSVQDCGRQALADLRNLLGLLRSAEGDDDAGALSPQPGLDDVPALLDRLEVAGLSVRLDRSGTPRPLAPGVDLAAFRIVQEALTNVLKHAAAPAASMTVRYADDGVDIEVVNTVNPRPPRSGTGHGLVGMRERTAVHGGTFEAGPRDDGEFAVSVHLPVGT